ncbi:hypothetical protein [Nostoc sp. LPT]|uniref:hypothetical protein n=1 Tax=Nostoc sp. LPT TaxID=2815387 RepID=UPI001DD74FB4|nr:hypothetical protein [Nostoc sp. LPT]MBN4005279.1 hypothetical protein [Nostoc sp. LPT]
MPEQFPIIDVPLDAPEADEDLGTKEKFWFRHQYLGRCLFKKARPNTGEDWAEKIAAELCFNAFCEAQKRYPDAARVWLNNLARVSSNDRLKLFERIPSNRISQTAIEFAQKILELNQSKLLDTLL